MKKTPFFYYSLLVGLLVLFTFSACKDKDDDDTKKPETKPSFEVIELIDSVAGNYLVCGDASSPLKCSYIVRNRTKDTIKYHIKLEKIQTEPDHFIEYCIGAVCVNQKVSAMLPIWSSDFPLTFIPNGQTNPDANSYIKMWSKNPLSIDDTFPPKAGMNRFRVTYYNVADETDFVSFVLTYNFHE
jgi:hypothetical protein